MMEIPTTNNSVPHGVAGAPNEQALLSLMERTGYSMIQENGQRKYGGPPPGWEGPAPARGCEVFVGKIPRDCYEDELAPIFEKIGKIYELRLMMDFSGSNRGYCFVMYTNKNDSKRAMKDLNNFEIRKGRFLGVCLSVDNCRLFVGGIPKNKTKEEILAEMTKVTEHVVDVIVYPSATDKTKNRGFAFVEYDSHRAAAMARRKLIPGRIQLWNHQIAVDWAEPEQDVDEDVMEKVKILYVRNLMLSTTEETLEKVFNDSAGSDSAVERVKKIRDYAFVHFKERQDALTAMNAMNDQLIEESLVEVTLAKPVDKNARGQNLEGSTLEVMLAKPVDKNEYMRYSRGAGRGATYPSVAQPAFTPYPYPGLDPSLYAAYPYGSAQFGAATAAAAATSFQNYSHIGGVASYRTNIRGRGRGAAGSRGAGGIGRGSYTNYMKRKMAPEILEDYCMKHRWGNPCYELHSTVSRDGSGDHQLFLFKVIIPALISQYPNFQPNKLCRSVDEAKNYAAEYVLAQLGLSIEGSEVDTSPRSPVESPVASMPPSAASLFAGRPIGGIPAAAASPYAGLAAAGAGLGSLTAGTGLNSAALAAATTDLTGMSSFAMSSALPLPTTSYMNLMSPGKLASPPMPSFTTFPYQY